MRTVMTGMALGASAVIDMMNGPIVSTTFFWGRSVETRNSQFPGLGRIYLPRQ